MKDTHDGTVVRSPSLSEVGHRDGGRRSAGRGSVINTQEGFFADPMYGGTRDKIGWKLVGFPGVAVVYTEHIDKHSVPYRVEPVSIADVQANAAQLDDHGHPRHVVTSLRP